MASKTETQKPMQRIMSKLDDNFKMYVSHLPGGVHEFSMSISSLRRAENGFMPEVHAYMISFDPTSSESVPEADKASYSTVQLVRLDENRHPLSEWTLNIQSAAIQGMSKEVPTIEDIRVLLARSATKIQNLLNDFRRSDSQNRKIETYLTDASLDLTKAALIELASPVRMEGTLKIFLRESF